MNLSNISITSLIMHQVGNFSAEEGIKFSEEVISHEKIEQDLIKLISNSFSGDNEIYHFTVEEALPSNHVKDTIKSIFDDPDEFYKKSIDLARLLYERSTHPSIKKGDFYIVSLENIQWKDHKLQAIALLKSEEKSTFLTVKNTANSFNISSTKGISLKKVDKACLILNNNEENGYTILVANNSKNNDAHYWINSFLHVKRSEDAYFQTEEFSKMFKEFILNTKETEKSLTNVERIEKLHETESYIAENSTLSVHDFKSVILNNTSLEDKFDKFRDIYQQNTGVKIDDKFNTSTDALKKVHKSMNKVIILDDNVRIYINKKYPLIEQGFDSDKNKHYYKIYFDDEKIK